MLHLDQVNSDTKFNVFVDFDGTITTQDVGEAMFLKFGELELVNNIIERWLKREISSFESWEQMCKSVNGFSLKIFHEFLDTIKIDLTFKNFVEHCEKNNIDIYVVSDGFDIYIKHILEREGLTKLKVFCNKMNIVGDKIIPVFPYPDEECKICANCKRNHIIDNSGDLEYNVYIGDGLSDTCPAQFCDLIFAKKSLLKFCEKNRITFSPFTNFNDVIDKLALLKNKKRLKKRFQASLKRNEVYIQG
ncbi:MAG TPA: MtnX-like HAD-IB family phosphatase [Melioribacteraceae bacterium]|nr:MtnX-like HAD-IB family phosphatase [Melioribacteraceae bacterium]